MTKAYRLQALLDLRAQALREAEQAVAQALGALTRAEATQSALDERVTVLAARLARHGKHERPAGLPGCVKAADLQAKARFLAQLESDWQDGLAAAQAHRQGPLEQARQRLEALRLAHRRARVDLELVERHREDAETQRQADSERRREDELDTWLRARPPGG